MDGLIVFDFDGVICNSIHDSLMTALNSYIELFPENSLPLTRQLSLEEILKFEADNSEFYSKFLNLMPFGNFARDYYVILKIIDKHFDGKINSQEDFDLYKRTIPEKILDEYQAIFYRKRYEIQSRDTEMWVSILPCFPGIKEAVASLSMRFALAIATSKDKRSVNLLLASYGMSRYFKDEDIIDKDFEGSKRDHIIRLHRSHSVPFGNIHFIDDKVLHLLDTRGLNVNCYLATWGFNTSREEMIALKNGFRLLRMEELKELGKESVKE